MSHPRIRPEDLGRRIDCALGRTPCELRLTNLRLLDVMNGRILEDAEIFIDQGLIVEAGVGCKATAVKTMDLNGGLAVPGLMDAHVHIESSMVTPVHFARLVAPFGTTCVVADPHEIANVLGITGIGFMLDQAKKAEIDIRFMLSSCVPSTPFETAGAELKAADLVELIDHERVLGLAELMNVPGLLAKDPDLLAKAAMALNAGKRIDGHAPLVAGERLSAYAACGVSTDHEASSAVELTDRLQRGIGVLMREGSAARNVQALAQAATPANWRFLSLCTDDSSPDDVCRRGHMNHVVRRAIECGIPAIEAIRMATVNTAQRYGLTGKGVLAPGYDADIAVIRDLTTMTVSQCFAKGRLLAQDGRMVTPEPEVMLPEAVKGCVRIQSLKPDNLTVATASGKARVIGIVEGNLNTRHLIESVRTRADGTVYCADNPGLVKLAVIERHRRTGRMGLGLLRGFVRTGEKLNGAIASTVAHDSHNIVVAGDSDADMLEAVRAIERMQGGLVLVREGKVVASLALDVAGLMASTDAAATGRAKTHFIETAHTHFAVPAGVHPVMTLSFLPLAVIPHLRVTDLGLFDVDAFRVTGIDPESPSSTTGV